MGFWDKSLRIFKCLGDNATQSIRHLAHQTGFSKSSVHRLKVISGKDVPVIQ
jgi:DNA-binding IclR family transcriptional regulator